MYLPNNYLSGDGTWYFTVQNGWTIAGNTNYDLDIILNGICDQAGCTDEWACNYDPDATVSDNSLCIYPDFVNKCIFQHRSLCETSSNIIYDSGFNFQTITG